MEADVCGPGTRLPGIRAVLAGVVLVCALTSLAGLGLLIRHGFARDRRHLEQDALHTARALSAAVDRDLAVGENVALAMATSPHLQSGDLGAFHRQAMTLLSPGFPGFNFVLSDASGQQRLNLLRPYGEPLPMHGNLDQLRKVFATGRPVLSDVFIGGVLRQPVVAFDVPVWREGKVLYDLSVGFLPERLGRILREQSLPQDRIISVLDTRGVHAACTPNHGTYLGRPGSPQLLGRMRETAEGVFEASAPDGVPALYAFSRSAHTDWTVAVGIPLTTLRAELRRSASFITLATGTVVLAGLAAAWVLGGLVGGSIRGLTEPALALGSGAPAVFPRPVFREAVEVAQALRKVEGELNDHRHRMDSLVAGRTEALIRANAELTDALARVRQLSGLLPICAYCKKVRNDRGYWDQIEAYVTEHSDATFSHGICPDCAEKVYAELRACKKGGDSGEAG